MALWEWADIKLEYRIQKSEYRRQQKRRRKEKAGKGGVREMLTFGNLRNKGTIPERTKEKGQRKKEKTEYRSQKAGDRIWA